MRLNGFNFERASDRGSVIRHSKSLIGAFDEGGRYDDALQERGTLQSSQTVPQGQVLFMNSKLESGFVLVSALAGRGVNSA